MKSVLKIVSYLSLVVMALSPVLVFTGTVESELNKTILLITTVLWFVTAPMWMKTQEEA